MLGRRFGSERMEEVLAGGKVLKAAVHSDFVGEEGRRLEGKCLDLESAFRQIAFSGAHQKAAITAATTEASSEVAPAAAMSSSQQHAA